MKKYFNVTYRVSNDIWSANLAHAENENDILSYYASKSGVRSNDDIIISDANDYAVEDAQRRGKPIVEVEHVETIHVLDVLDDLDLGDYGEYMNDYRGTNNYICDAITEAADGNVDIYYSDIIKYIADHTDDVNDAINEFGWDGVGRDIYKAGQMAQFSTIEHDIYDHLDDVLIMLAVNVAVYEYHINDVDAETWDAIIDDVATLDNNDRMDDVDAIIEKHLGEGASND